MNIDPVINLSDISSIYDKTKSWQQVKSMCGTKAVNLTIASINSTGFSTPKGFVITKNGFDVISNPMSFISSATNSTKLNSKSALPSAIWDKVIEQIRKIEDSTKLKYGGENPLFFALNNVSPSPGSIFVGMNDYTVRMFEKRTKNRSYAYYCYSKYIRSYGILVLNAPANEFDQLFDNYMSSRNIPTISKFNSLDWIQITKLYKSVIVRYSGVPFPQDSLEQLKQLIIASVSQYRSENSTSYRSFVQDDSTIGPSTLITVMSCNVCNDKSCVGVASSHNLITGEPKISGIFGSGAVVEDIAEEIFPIKPIEDLNGSFPDSYKTLKNSLENMTKIFKEPITVRFVIEEGQLTIVSIRRSTFSGFARFHATVSIVDSKLTTTKEAISAIYPSDMRSIVNPKIKGFPRSSFCSGVSSTHGAATGIISMSNSDTITKAKRGQKVVYVKKRFCHSDINALINSDGLVTVNGGLYSSSMYYSNILCKPSAIGCQNLMFDDAALTITCGNITASIGDEITIENGKVYMGALPLILPDKITDEAVNKVLKWIDEVRSGHINVFTSVTSLDDVILSQKGGADGIGLFRIENFITNDREAITSFFETKDKKIAVEIEDRLCSSFSDLFAAAGSKTVTIQLLDDNLSSFLTSPDDLTEQIATLKTHKKHSSEFNSDDLLNQLQEELNHVLRIIDRNPLLSGLHGTRLYLESPQLFSLQVRSILRGANASRRRGAEPHIRIMLPIVNDAEEVVKLDAILNDLMIEFDEMADIGAMIECPRACYIGPDLAEVCQFISFNSDTLHEMTFGMCKEDAEANFLNTYEDLRILPQSPFVTIDQKGVGRLMKTCIDEAKDVKNDTIVCITGNNCFDVSSVDFCYNIGIDTITCKPLMAPVARLCAAQAVISKEEST
ncbi:hypothetical protein M9Y10_029181 [Tritrichomonas musculus]|uniref:Pyruvate, phosphate dikinase n=1 Tax=Tritrichomonas musculus TaxID=1915356 RepID=A0ABR2KLE9_9EUKA